MITRPVARGGGGSEDPLGPKGSIGSSTKVHLSPEYHPPPPTLEILAIRAWITITKASEDVFRDSFTGEPVPAKQHVLLH